MENLNAVENRGVYRRRDTASRFGSPPLRILAHNKSSVAGVLKFRYRLWYQLHNTALRQPSAVDEGERPFYICSPHPRYSPHGGT